MMHGDYYFTQRTRADDDGFLPSAAFSSIETSAHVMRTISHAYHHYQAVRLPAREAFTRYHTCQALRCCAHRCRLSPRVTDYEGPGRPDHKNTGDDGRARVNEILADAPPFSSSSPSQWQKMQEGHHLTTSDMFMLTTPSSTMRQNVTTPHIHIITPPPIPRLLGAMSAGRRQKQWKCNEATTIPRVITERYLPAPNEDIATNITIDRC